MAKYVPLQGQYGDTVWVNPDQVAVLWQAGDHTKIRIVGGTHSELSDYMVIHEHLLEVLTKLTV
jgi:hypothetical protein